jgi:hypothetical protein
VPFGTVLLFQLASHPAMVGVAVAITVVLNVRPVNRNCTCVVPAVALASRTSLPDTTVPAAGSTTDVFGATLSVAAFVVAEPIGLVNCARNSQPFMERIGVPLRVSDVAPVMLIHVVPWSPDTCHWTVGVVSVLAAAVKVAVCPTLTVWLAG